jgi:hypothetical protein
MTEMAEIPHVEGHEYELVFATYGQTMSYAQSLEATIKYIVCLYNYLEKNKVEPVDDETAEKIITEHDHSTLGGILKKLQERMGGVDEAVREEGLRQLRLLKDARNSLAHSYVVNKQSFIAHPEGRKLVIAQLRHYARSFNIATEQFTILLRRLLSGLIPPQIHAQMMKLWQEAMGVAIESVGLEHYRKKLEECGAI